MQLERPPSLSRHAAERASERLCMGHSAMQEFVDATWNEWLPVNSDFLHARGLTVSSQRSLLFVTPWTAGIGLALVVSDDRLSIKTVLTFRQPSRLAEAVKELS